MDARNPDTNPANEEPTGYEPRLLGPAPSARTALVPPIAAARWIILLIVFCCVYFFHDFLLPVLAALIIGFASWPLYLRVLGACGGNRTLAASLMIAGVVLFLVLPVVLAAAYAVRELQSGLQWAIAANVTGAPAPEWFATLPFGSEWAIAQWNLYVGRPGGMAEVVQAVGVGNIGNIYRSILAVGGKTIEFLLDLLFMVIALLFIYRDGASFAAQIDRFGERIFPRRWGRISRVVPAVIHSTVTGMTLIAIGEGIVLGTAYWLAGAPSPVTLGLATGVLAMIPGGAPTSMTMVSLFLLARGSIFEGLALFAWGTVELFVVDKTIRPKLVGGPVKLPFLPTFFGLIGGVKTMGFVGLFIGPVLMALLVAIWRESVRDLDKPATTPVESIPNPYIAPVVVETPRPIKVTTEL